MISSTLYRIPPTNGRPLSIAELAERAKADPWDPQKPLKHWLWVAECSKNAGERCAAEGDFENAFVELVKAATIVLEQLPTHEDYRVLLNSQQRHNMGLHGQEILDLLSEVKGSLVERYDNWQEHQPFTSTQPSPSSRQPDAAAPQIYISAQQGHTGRGVYSDVSPGGQTPATPASSSSTPSSHRSRGSAAYQKRTSYSFVQAQALEREEAARRAREDATRREEQRYAPSREESSLAAQLLEEWVRAEQRGLEYERATREQEERRREEERKQDNWQEHQSSTSTQPSPYSTESDAAAPQVYISMQQDHNGLGVSSDVSTGGHMPVTPASSQGFLMIRELSASSSGREEGLSVVTWWSAFNKRRHVSRSSVQRSERGLSEEQVLRISDARKRVIRAALSVVGRAGEVAHQALTIGVDFLDLAPVPGLAPAGHILLDIWNAFEKVQSNRSSCLRLTERCANILASVREEVVSAGSATDEELKAPIDRLHESFREVLVFLKKQMDMPLLKRFLGRDKTFSDIERCDKYLTDALGMLGLSIQIRTFKLIQASQRNVLRSLASKNKLQEALEEIQNQQGKKDKVQDLADLRQLLRAAVQNNDDAEMVEILQVRRDEMPEALKALERTLNDYIIKRDQSTGSNPEDKRKRSALLARIRISLPKLHVDTDADIDRQFMESGIESLRRLTLSQGYQPHLPSWTITRYEIDVDQMIGVGFFSNVYKGTWRNRIVAIKMLAEATPKELFVHEANIWKMVSHPNILQLLGASSTSSDPPWFLVSPYYKNGNLVKFLKGLSVLTHAVALQMMHEIASGMCYLHEHEVLHGDLKAVNVLVDDTLRCVITDFGQSEMKSEVYRLSRIAISRGTLRWQAPELMNGSGAITKKTDVYAFAITCAEILTKGSLPWPVQDDAAVRHAVLVEQGRPPLSSSSLPTDMRLQSVLDACWNHESSSRSSFSQISTYTSNRLLQLTRDPI